MGTATLAQQATARPAGGDDYVAGAVRLAPLIEAAAARAERNCEIAPDVMVALHDAGLLRLLAPRSIGGVAMDPHGFAEVIEIIAAADASTAWCVNQTSVCSAGAAFMTPEAVRMIFGSPDGLLAWGAGPKAKAVETEGGYRVTGTWQFASGSRHAAWMGGHCPVFAADGTPRSGPDGRQIERTMLFPRDSARIDDVWQVMGLKGTGSDTYSVADLFVPHELSCPTLTDWIDSTPSDPAPLYRFSGSGLYAAGFGAIALGNARGMLEAFVRLARVKTARGAKNTLCDSPVIQMQIAQADSRLRAARAFLHQSLREARDVIRTTGRMTVDQRMRVRAAGTWAIHQGTEALESIYRAAGATAIFENAPFERRFRDGYSISQHLQGRLAHFELVGKHLLGVETDLQFV
jgi:alkylation response protein AidB-like acyl-CoA dehydrogenase